jgi:hypothetical protein
MLKPKSHAPRGFWQKLSDEVLIETDLIVDDPETLENLVYELPAGDEEPYVEFKYDLRMTEREKLHCVHGNHPHLSGFVMRKGGKRFLVGRICGKTIYNEDFDAYTADFDAAIIRKDALVRVREIRTAVDPFMAWLQEVSQSDAFKHFGKLRGRLYEELPWVYDNLEVAALTDHRVKAAKLPRWLCSNEANPREEFNRVLSDADAVSSLLSGEPEKAAGMIGLIRSRIETLMKRTEEVLARLGDVELFFQPGALHAICALANEHDNPKKRKYSSGLLTITCKKERHTVTIAMPKDFAIPSVRRLEALRSALNSTR